MFEKLFDEIKGNPATVIFSAVFVLIALNRRSRYVEVRFRSILIGSYSKEQLRIQS